MTDGDGDGKESSGEVAMSSSDGTKMINPLAGTGDGDDESED